MTRMINRRRLLSLLGAGVGGAAAAMAGCSPERTRTTPTSTRLTFWHNNGEMRALFESIAREFGAERGGRPVEMHYEPLTTLGKSLQLARQSRQMPDIHVLAGLEIPAATLQAQDWFQPIDLGDAADRLPVGSLVDGIHVFDGRTYSFPIVSFRQYWAPVWYFADSVERLGLDPDGPPRTYDEFRAACRTVKKKSDGRMFGWMSKLGVGNHMGPEIEEIAQAGGFAGAGGIDFRTGEYAYHSDPFVAAVEFLVSLHRDKLMFPGSLTLDGTQAQVRWAGGASAYWMDGPWLPTFVKANAPDLEDQLRVSTILVPDASSKVTTYRGPQGGAFWISSQSKQPAAASRLLREHFTTRDFYRGVAESSAVPADLSVVDDAEVTPAYRQLVDWYAQQVFLAPSPVVANPEVAKVLAETKPIAPDYGNTLLGLFTGDLTDVRRAMKQLSDRASAERERALAAAVEKGARVSLDDYAFPDWTPAADYQPS